MGERRNWGSEGLRQEVWTFWRKKKLQVAFVLVFVRASSNRRVRSAFDWAHEQWWAPPSKPTARWTRPDSGKRKLFNAWGWLWLYVEWLEQESGTGDSTMRRCRRTWVIPMLIYTGTFQEDFGGHTEWQDRANPGPSKTQKSRSLDLLSISGITERR